MTIPTSNPTTTEPLISAQFSIFNAHKMANVANTMRIELRFVPNASDFNKSFILASSRVRTENIPIIESNIPTAAISIGAITAFICISVSPAPIKAAAPKAEVANIEPQYDSYKSAPIPATSPTLSPTLSAIVAGLRGSSSGIPA